MRVRESSSTPRSWRASGYRLLAFVLILAACSPIDTSSSEHLRTALERFCDLEFDCDQPEVLYVRADWIDSDVVVGQENPIDEQSRIAIGAGLGRSVLWLEAIEDVESVLASDSRAPIVTVGEPQRYDYVVEVDVGWSRGLDEGKITTMSVELGTDLGSDDRPPVTTAVP